MLQHCQWWAVLGCGLLCCGLWAAVAGMLQGQDARPPLLFFACHLLSPKLDTVGMFAGRVVT
jgi:hypothetical protein